MERAVQWQGQSETIIWIRDVARRTQQTASSINQVFSNGRYIDLGPKKGLPFSKKKVQGWRNQKVTFFPKNKIKI